MSAPHKVCTKCGEDKPLDEYPPQKGRRDGHGSICKACRKRYNTYRRDGGTPPWAIDPVRTTFGISHEEAAGLVRLMLQQPAFLLDCLPDNKRDELIALLIEKYTDCYGGPRGLPKDFSADVLRVSRVGNERKKFYD